MDKKILNTLPAYIYDFKETASVRNKFMTEAKLKAFYKGTTADGRTFTEEFAEKLLQTLPLVPVVGYYSEEDEDFVGHNTEQYVYGVVPETAKFSFETDENGVEWAVTEVALFTGRQDNIGEIAKKIVGKQHSLEMDPDTIDYDIVCDASGNLKEIIFKDGHLVGLSVLGNNETPAFTGSAFFTSQEVKTMIKEFTSYNKEIQLEESGGLEMNKFDSLSQQEIKFLSSFLEKSYSELAKEICDKFKKFDNRCSYYIMEIFESGSVVAYDYADNNYYKFTQEDGEFSADRKEQAWMHYLVQSEIDTLSVTANVANASTEEDVIEPQTEDAFASDKKEEEEDKSDCAKDEEDDDKKSKCVDEEDDEDDKDEDKEEDEEDDDKEDYSLTAEADPEPASESFTTEGGEIENEQKQPAQEEPKQDTNFTTLDDEDRRELEAYRTKEKEQIIEKYSKYLTDEEKAEYIAKIGEYNRATLTSALSIKMSEVIFKQQEDTERKDSKSIPQIFQAAGQMFHDENEDGDPTDRLVKKYMK